MVWKSFFGRSVTVLAAIAGAWSARADFTMTILHTNDMHAHVEPTKVSGVSVGGYARQATLLLRLREESKNPILLNAGDTFQGTLYFNTYEGLADLAFMNLVGYQAACLGNHEFDRGPGPLSNFVKMAAFPIVSANLDFSKEPLLDGQVKPYTVLNVDGQEIGVVGGITPDLPNISSAGPTVKMLDYVSSIQKSVDELIRSGVNKIILLTHSGYDFDKETASKLRGIDVVVGGHSHTLLGTVEIPKYDGSRGPYPTVVKDKAGQDVLIVQAWEWGKVVGKLQVTFDDKGIVKSYEGAPVMVDDTIPEDPYVAELMAAFKKPIEAMQAQKVADLTAPLTREYGDNGSDSTMGDVVADAVLAATKAQGAEVAFWNAGGVRSGLDAGSVTYGKLIEVCPFGNTLVVLDLKGSELLAALDEGIGNGGMLYPSAGFSYTFDAAAPAGKKIVSATLGGVAISPEKTYKVTFSNFTSGGGDAHTALKNAKGKRIETGFVDIDALVEYFKKNTPVSPPQAGRIKAKK